MTSVDLRPPLVAPSRRVPRPSPCRDTTIPPLLSFPSFSTPRNNIVSANVSPFFRLPFHLTRYSLIPSRWFLDFSFPSPLHLNSPDWDNVSSQNRRFVPRKVISFSDKNSIFTNQPYLPLETVAQITRQIIVSIILKYAEKKYWYTTHLFYSNKRWSRQLARIIKKRKKKRIVVENPRNPYLFVSIEEGETGDQSLGKISPAAIGRCRLWARPRMHKVCGAET